MITLLDNIEDLVGKNGCDKDDDDVHVTLVFRLVFHLCLMRATHGFVIKARIVCESDMWPSKRLQIVIVWSTTITCVCQKG